MPSLTSTLAIGLSLLIAVPVLALSGGGGGCPDATGAPPSTTPSPTPSAALSALAPLRPSPQRTATTWDAEQLATATTIVRVGQAKNVPVWGQIIALATAMQESSLRNLPDGDRDSIGAFQQRPSAGWGTVTQLRSVDYQARRFYNTLTAIPNWQSLPLDVAAQTVQRSAHPGAYAAWTRDATNLLAQLGNTKSAGGPEVLPISVGPVSCFGPADDGDPAGSPPELPPGFTLPADTPQAVAAAITWALTQRGTPYSYGGDCTDPHSGDQRRACDCSSLIQVAYRSGGIQLPRTTTEQATAGTPVRSLTDLQPGDLIFIPGADGTPNAPGHVALYIADGLAIHAPQTGDVVRLTNITRWTGSIVAIRRIITGSRRAQT